MPSEKPVEPAAAATWETPTDDECRQFAAKIEQAVQSGDVRAIDAAIDFDALLESVTSGIEGAEDTRRGFIQGAKESMRGAGSFGYRLYEETAGGGSYRLVRIREKDGQRRALFRLLYPDDGGFTYNEFILVRKPSGQVQAIDVFVYRTSETLSQTMRRLYLPLAASESRTVVDRLSPAESDLVESLLDCERLAEELETGRFQEALATYRSFPPSLQKEKCFLLVRLMAAENISEQEHKAAIEAFRRYHPDDPCLDLLLIDDYIAREKYNDALGCIDRLDKALGGDPYLDVVRANIHSREQNYTEAKRLAKQAIAEDPRFVDAYRVLVLVSLAEKDFAETTRLLKRMDEKSEAIQFEDLRTLPGYAEYVKSPHYQEWLDSQRR